MTPILLALTTCVAGDAGTRQPTGREPVAAARVITFSFPGRCEVVIHADAIKYRFEADRRTRTVRLWARGSDFPLARMMIEPGGLCRTEGLQGGTLMMRRGPPGSVQSVSYIPSPGECIDIDFIKIGRKP